LSTPSPIGNPGVWGTPRFVVRIEFSNNAGFSR
jgi:hypothetical protein